MSWKDTNRTCQILKAAEENVYGIVSAVAYNLEHIIAFIRIAERKRSPILILFFPWAITFSDGLIIHAAAHAARNATVPVALHLDHAQDEAQIRLVANTLPFDSIMIDMSHYEYEENLAKTRELVAYCHARQIATEAEPGRIEGGEDGLADTADLEGALTTPEQVEEFISTGIDFLAPAFGNIHGEYGPRGIQLNYDLLEKVRAQAAGRVRLVLHGTNSFDDKTMKKCIKGGISKVNVNKLVLDDYHVFQREKASSLSLTAALEGGVEATMRLVEQQIDVCGSAGKA